MIDVAAKLGELRQFITAERCKALLVDLVRVPSPQTALMEAEPQLRTFIETAVAPRLSAMGFADIRYDGMGNLISTVGAGTSGKSLMLITNAMNQPAATMPNAYAGDVADGAPLRPCRRSRARQGRERAEGQHGGDARRDGGGAARRISARRPARSCLLRVGGDRQPCRDPQRRSRAKACAPTSPISAAPA